MQAAHVNVLAPMAGLGFTQFGPPAKDLQDPCGSKSLDLYFMGSMLDFILSINASISSLTGV